VFRHDEDADGDAYLIKVDPMGLAVREEPIRYVLRCMAGQISITFLFV